MMEQRTKVAGGRYETHGDSEGEEQEMQLRHLRSKLRLPEEDGYSWVEQEHDLRRPRLLRQKEDRT